MSGAIRFRDSLRAVGQLSVETRAANHERHALDECVLQFREAQTLEAWWAAVGVVASELGLQGVSVRLNNRAGGHRELSWGEPEGMPDVVSRLAEIRITLQDRWHGGAVNVVARMRVDRSLEFSGRRLAQLCRILEQNGMKDLRTAVIPGHAHRRQSGRASIRSVETAS